MHPGTYDNFAAAEETHWWFRHRRALAREWLRRIHADDAVVLDLGCGTGSNLAMLAGFARKVVALDLSERALALCAAKHPGAALVRGDANDLGRTVAAESIDLATLFNVLYHSWVADDRHVLADVRRVLKPGGRVLVCETAFKSLRRRRDLLDYGARRYRVAELKRMLEGLGFEIERTSYFNAVGFVPVWLLARFDRWSGACERAIEDGETDRDLDVSSRWLHRLGYWLTGIERAWLRLGGRLPFGVNLLIVARKTADPPGSSGSNEQQ